MDNLNQKPQDAPFSQQIVSALIQFLYSLAFILFLCPFNFWKKAVIRLYNDRTSRSWDFAKSGSRWPFLSFLKAILFGFVFDGLIFISYIVGVIFAFYALYQEGFGSFIIALVGAYYFPMVISPIRDLLYIMLLPFTKFLSWCARPAQYLEIDMKKKD